MLFGYTMGMAVLNRRSFTASSAALLLQGADAVPARRKSSPVALELIGVPCNLGLRPNEDGSEPGTWRAPEVLFSAGLKDALRVRSSLMLPRPKYDFAAQAGTRIRNGRSLRDYSQLIAHSVERSLRSGNFPIIVGGDCSILIGSILGARRANCRGLVHLDGHSDFFHPGNYDTRSRLGTAAGMDLAIVTGRGEPLLTVWPGIAGPLVADDDTIQLGERDALLPEHSEFYEQMAATKIARMIIQDVLQMGIPAAAAAVEQRLRSRDLDRVWLHIDLDVLDEAVMPAVDSPGSPGLAFDQLGQLVHVLLATNRLAGCNIAIYDPDRDPGGKYAHLIVETIGDAFAGLASQAEKPRAKGVKQRAC